MMPLLWLVRKFKFCLACLLHFSRVCTRQVIFPPCFFLAESVKTWLHSWRNDGFVTLFDLSISHSPQPRLPRKQRESFWISLSRHQGSARAAALRGGRAWRRSWTGGPRECSKSRPLSKVGLVSMSSTFHFSREERLGREIQTLLTMNFFFSASTRRECTKEDPNKSTKGDNSNSKKCKLQLHVLVRLQRLQGEL